MKSNGDKCHLIVSTNDTAEIQIGEYLIKSSTNERLLGVNIDSKLTFDSHVRHLCNKANKKLRALARITPYMTLEKKKLVMNYFFNARFNYSPLIWMLHTRKNSIKINYLHERCLRLIYSDKKSSYENLLENDNSVSIHHKNIQALAIEMFKVKHKLCPDITSDIFKEWTNNTIYEIAMTSLFLGFTLSIMEQKVLHILAQRYGILFLKKLNKRNL